MKQLNFNTTYSKDAYFNIEPIQGVEKKRNEPKYFAAHSHDYYVIICISEGTGKHIIDFKDYNITPKSIFFLSPNQIHSVNETTVNKGFVISFNHEFLLKSNINSRFFENINLFHALGDTPPLLPDDNNYFQLIHYCQEMIVAFSTNSIFKYESLGALLKLFLINCNQLCNLPNEDAYQTADNAIITILNFKNLVEQHFKTLHKTTEYAHLLHISSNYLNKLVKMYLHTTAKEFIQNRIILETKRLLYDGKLSVKEIAYQLGFNEPAHLSNAFKNCTQQSITAYKKTL
ncbi:AraC family transcriptional regulator [Zhouia sp. PK063]|uniref:AraC family transcriptional regulator n=1 Tax=Zhouia sp. PK063 TaxID=3373602 RepID=UPI0037933F36